MSLFRKIVFRRFFISILALFIFALVLMSSIFFGYSQKERVSETEKTGNLMLDQIITISDTLYRQMWAVSEQVIANKEIQWFLQANQRNFVLEYRSTEILRYHQTLIPSISYIGVYNGKIDKYINTFGISNVDGLNNSRESPYLTTFNCISTTVTYPYETRTSKKTEDTIAFILQISEPSQIKTERFVAIHLKADYVRNLLKGLIRTNQDAVYLYGTDGQLLSLVSDINQSDKLPFAYWKPNLVSEKERGFFLSDNSLGKDVVSWARSEVMGWTLIYTRPYSAIVDSIAKMQLTFLLIVGVILVIGVWVSFYISRRIHRPLYNMVSNIHSLAPSNNDDSDPVDEYQYLQDVLEHASDAVTQMEANEEITRKRLIAAMLKGEPLDSPIEAEQRQALSDQYDNFRHICIIIAVDEYKQFKIKHDDRMRTVLLHGMMQQCEEELRLEFDECETVYMGDGLIAALVEINTSFNQEKLINTLRIIQKNIASTLTLSLSAIFSDPVDTLSDLAMAYHQVRSGISYRLFCKSGSIISFEMITLRENKTPIYPLSTEKALLDSIHGGHINELPSLLRQFIDEISQASYSSFLLSCYRFLANLSVYNIYSGMSHAGKLDVDQIADCESLSEVQKLMIDACTAFMDDMRRRYGSNERSKHVIMMEYVQQHYTDPSITLDTAAEAVGLSREYAGRVFRQACQISFSDYLNKYRLDAAQKILIESNQPVRQIAAEVGYDNISYFYTLFRRQYGITPTNYRRQHKDN